MLITLVGLGLVYLGYSLYSLKGSQWPSFEEFGAYLVNRLGIGQMAGMYETMAFAKRIFLASDFYWYIIPFARFLLITFYCWVCQFIGFAFVNENVQIRYWKRIGYCNSTDIFPDIRYYGRVQ